MADVLNQSVVGPARESEKSYDFAILVSVGLACHWIARRDLGKCPLRSAGIDPISLDLVNSYPCCVSDASPRRLSLLLGAVTETAWRRLRCTSTLLPWLHC
jgi:hypothetical protein